MTQFPSGQCNNMLFRFLPKVFTLEAARNYVPSLLASPKSPRPTSRKLLHVTCSTCPKAINDTGGFMALSALHSLLQSQNCIILDGAQGTELERRGCKLGASKLWSAQLLLDDPAMVKAVHADYLNAGSDIISTFT
jgi:hypothetical protein